MCSVCEKTYHYATKTLGRTLDFTLEQAHDRMVKAIMLVLLGDDKSIYADDAYPSELDVTIVAPGAISQMAASGARPTPQLQAAIDRARNRKAPQE